ncbi:DinB family protein [Maribacter polysiphoniae]|uniref:DinB family protein n=1 Tax=Maribacter polysiphoniae TaxID=429344 RepID=A0A316E8N1_9FLAO|nr:DinB family protein [Maribacter polysiphoniae]MBD1260257.1 DinB family protein [Maribacter polysiphoniae]PWK25719.1 DinB family protein [Maribacter polysiphoniae]
MERLFDITLQNRNALYSILTKTPKELLLKIPSGYRNNIWWNIAHVVVTQQLLVYKLSGLDMKVADQLVDKFRKGTVPDGKATEEELDAIKGFLFSSIEWTQEDYENGVFKNFNEYTTSANVTLKNVEDAIAFNLFHEGLHLGVVLSLEKVLLAED